MIPLSVHSAYSFGWGASSPAAICRHARRLGYDRLALTDTDNLCGLMPFVAACDQEGIRPIIGAAVTDLETPARAVCLVKDRQGYENLCRLLTRRHMRPDFALTEGIVAFSKGLVVLTTNPALLYAGHEAGIDIAAALPRKPLPAGHGLRRAARHTGAPLVAVPGSFFNHPEEFSVHKVLRAIDRNTAVCRLTSGDTASPDAFLAGPEYYHRRFEVCPDAVCNTLAIGERLAFTRPDFGLVLPPWEADAPEAAAFRLRSAAYEGARGRYGDISDAVAARLEHELDMISKMGFCGYFLIVADIVAHSPRTCGRGSGAASLVAYCLGITNVCPVKYNLYFERFLNPGRTDPPDIDVDFAWDERDAVIAVVLEKYGGRAAMVSSHIGFQGRMAVREVARVSGLTEREIGRVTEKLPWGVAADAAERDWAGQVAALPRMRGVDLSPPWPSILSMAARITGLPRHLSVHSGGVVITPGPIDAFVPVQAAPKGVNILQWDKDAVADAGLVKIDLLGNRSLGVIRDAMADIREADTGIDEAAWVPEEDPPTRDTVARGETMGCFYIESPAMRLLQRKTGVGDFAHLVIHSSIIRPAANDVIQEYIRRLHGGGWQGIHPLVEDVLAETYGLMIFQEDVSRVAVAAAGFSHSDADGLRKVMSKKDRVRRLGDYFDRFGRGAAQRGLDHGQIERLWRMIMSFNGYSFCKPHSASYARISFEAAYLKTHFPAAFMAAVISNQGGFYTAFAYVSEAMRMGITIRPPDVAESRVRWKGAGRTMRVGLMAVKGLSSETMARIVKERENARFTDMIDFLDRIRPDGNEARALIHCGALDCFSRDKTHRGRLRWTFSEWQRRRDRKDTTLSLFADPAVPTLPSGRNISPETAPPLPPDDPMKNRRREFAVLGFLCDRHPMTLFADHLKGKNTVKAAHIGKYAGRRIRFAGWLITGKTILTGKGDPMRFVTFEDETGLVETVFFPGAYDRFCHLLEYGRPFLLSGKVEIDRGAASLSVDAAAPLYT